MISFFLRKYRNNAVLIKVGNRALTRIGVKNIMRARRFLNENGAQDKITLINENISNRIMDPEIDAVPTLNISRIDLEISYRQFLFVNFGGYALTSLILQNIGTTGKSKGIYPIPRSWRVILSENGITVRNSLSDILWQLKMVRYGFINLLKIIRLFFLQINHSQLINYSNGCVLFSVPASNTVNDHKILNKYSIFSEIARIECLPKDQIIIAEGKFEHPRLKNSQGNEVVLTKSFWASILKTDGKKKLFSIFLLLSLLFDSLKHALYGNLSHFLFIKEIFISQLASHSQKELVNKHFYFHSGSYIYRPLWSYFIEKPEGNVTMYFCSSNIQQFSRVQLKAPNRMHPGYASMTWPRYLCWNECQANILRKLIKPSKIDIVGPIEFGGKKLTNNICSKKSIALFDIAPIRSSFYSSLAVEFDYYNFENSRRFITDVLEMAKKYGYTIVYKEKRPQGSIAHKGFQGFIKKIDSSNANFSIVDSSTAASSLISKCELVISMPFTSTALLSSTLSKNSIYYDAGMNLEKFEPGSGNVPFLRGLNELDQYFYKLSN